MKLGKLFVAKAILTIIGTDIQEAAGVLQLCGGYEAAANHSMHLIFDDPATEAAILVDATNTFNNLNRQSAVINIRLTCPSLVRQLLTHIMKVVSYLLMGILSEGTTQGDQLAMAMYGNGILPLIKKLQNQFSKFGMLMIKELEVNLSLFINGGIS